MRRRGRRKRLRALRQEEAFLLARSLGATLFLSNRATPSANKIVAIAHNAKAFDFHFILNWASILKWKPELNMNGLKIMCMKLEHLVFLDSVFYLPCPLLKLPYSFGVTARKSSYPHYFNTEENLDYVGPIPDVRYYDVNELGEGRGGRFSSGTRERSQFSKTGAC